jgi:hypothetical protein
MTRKAGRVAGIVDELMDQVDIERAIALDDAEEHTLIHPHHVQERQRGQTGGQYGLESFRA